MDWRLVLSASLCAAFLFASPAMAQDLEKAKEAFMVGKEAYDKNDYKLAAQKFVEAHEYSGRSELLYNIGLAYQGAGELPLAETYFQRYLTELPKAKNADEVLDLVIEIQQQIAANYGTLEIDASSSAQIFVQGEATPRCEKTPCSLTLKSGDYTLVARASGFLETTEKVTAESGKTGKIRIALNAERELGFLAIESDREAMLSLNGQTRGQLPLAKPLEVEPGTYTVLLQSARNVSWTGQVVVEPDLTSRIVVPLDASVDAAAASSWKRQVAFIAGAGALGLGIGGMWMGAQAQSSFDALEAQQASRGFVDADLRETGQNQQFAANVLYGVAATALLGATGLFVWDWMGASDEYASPSEESEPTPAEPASEPAPADEEIDLL